MIRLGAYAVLDDQDSYLHFLKQYGVEDVVLIIGSSQAEILNRFPPDKGTAVGQAWTVDELIAMRRRCEAFGFRVIAMENPVPPWCMDHIKLGLPGRDQQIENLAVTIRHMGQAGVPVLGYHWMVNPPDMTRASWRTDFSVPARGGATLESFDNAVAASLPLFRDRVYTEDEMWANYAYFIDAIRPVLTEAGVRLAAHPDDPPIDTLGGVPRLLRSFETFKRALDIADSPVSALNFCLGNWTAMGTDIVAAIRYFGPRGKIIYGHLQGVQGKVPSFRECFMDESDCDFPAVLRALVEVGFDGPLLPAHVPHTAPEAGRQFVGHAYGFGYLKGMIAML